MTDIPFTIGASDVGAVLGLSTWQTPAQAWARLSGLSPTDGGNNATRRGNLIERALLMDVADVLGVAFWRYGDAAGHTCVAVAGPVDSSATLETGDTDRAANMTRFAERALEELLAVLKKAG